MPVIKISLSKFRTQHTHTHVGRTKVIFLPPYTSTLRWAHSFSISHVVRCAWIRARAQGHRTPLIPNNILLLLFFSYVCVCL